MGILHNPISLILRIWIIALLFSIPTVGFSEIIIDKILSGTITRFQAMMFYTKKDIEHGLEEFGDMNITNWDRDFIIRGDMSLSKLDELKDLSSLKEIDICFSVLLINHNGQDRISEVKNNCITFQINDLRQYIIETMVSNVIWTSEEKTFLLDDKISSVVNSAIINLKIKMNFKKDENHVLLRTQMNSNSKNEIINFVPKI